MYKTVYRIENLKTGNGPYISNGDYDAIVYNKVHSNICSKHLGIYNECGRGIRSHEFCGFTSITQLRKWFNNSILRFILKRNFAVLVYHGAQVTMEGKKQCLFIKPKNNKKVENITEKFLDKIRKK